ncbi:hypothetical protein LJC11_04650 [Bacteroidales bacterium OttesenSCG-928-I21]|nr:hypothetical protein [Bacteroidales bacterium OttesenSCG-928-I21]
MKKISLLLLINIILFSCTSKLHYGGGNNDLMKQNLTGTVKSTYERYYELTSNSGKLDKGNKTSAYGFDTYRLFNKDGFIIQKKTFNFDNSPVSTTVYEYEDENILLKETKYTATENIDKVYIYAYNEKTKLLESQTTYSAFGRVEYIDKYSYQNGLLTEVENFDGQNKSIYKWKYEYDKDGNKIKDTWHINNNITELFYTYDEESHIIKQKEINESKNVTTWEFAYDKNENKIKEVRTYSDGSQAIINIIYEYDKFDNWVVQKVFEEDMPVYVIERTIEYY